MAGLLIHPAVDLDPEIAKLLNQRADTKNAGSNVGFFLLFRSFDFDWPFDDTYV